MAKERVYRVTFTDGSKCTVKLKNKRGKTINTAGAMEYAEFVHNKKVVEIESW